MYVPYISTEDPLVVSISTVCINLVLERVVFGVIPYSTIAVGAYCLLVALLAYFVVLPQCTRLLYGDATQRKKNE